MTGEILFEGSLFADVPSTAADKGPWPIELVLGQDLDIKLKAKSHPLPSDIVNVLLEQLVNMLTESLPSGEARNGLRKGITLKNSAFTLQPPMVSTRLVITSGFSPLPSPLELTVTGGPNGLRIVEQPDLARILKDNGFHVRIAALIDLWKLI